MTPGNKVVPESEPGQIISMQVSPFQRARRTGLHAKIISALSLITWLTYADVFAVTIHVSPRGDDGNSGTAAKPLAPLAAAQSRARQSAGHEPVTVLLHNGIFYLPETLVFTAADSGTKKFPVVYAAAQGEQPVLSGGVRLKPEWTPFRDGIFQAKTPDGLVMDQVFVNGERQHMARYPNYDPKVQIFNGTAADAIAPERVARWGDPAGGFIHAMHGALWGGMHYRILGRKADGSLEYEGGWQNNRPSSMHKQFRFVENIREELDAPGEWFHDAKANTLFYMPQAGVDLQTATIEVVRLRHLIEFNGTKEQPVKFVTLRGLTFRHATRTFMETREPVLRSDWAIYRGGAVTFNGAEDSAIENCDFDQLGGNTIFVNNFNRRITVRGCLIRESGANGVAFVGDPQAVRQGLDWKGHNDFAALDRTPGPKTENFPANCLVEDCLITRSGRFEKQTAPVEIDMAQNITVRHCSIYDVPRAGINIGDGCWGGHVIEFCDVFDTVQETGDHGSFNSWGRDRFWGLRGVPDGELPKRALLDVVRPNTLRNNRWRCDHGWDIDLDDGSSHYFIYNNLLLNGGLKLREGFQRTATNNVIVGNSLHPHVWFENSGDVFARNIVMGAYRPAIMKIAKWGAEVDHNFFTTSETDRTQFAAQGCDAHSLVGDAQFVNAATGDFRVRNNSPALQVGFRNFPMNEFGVTSPRLKAIARTPEIPSATTKGAQPPGDTKTVWFGASLRRLTGQEYSALGVAADAQGVFVAEVPKESIAFKAGLRAGDFIQQANGVAVRGTEDFLSATRNLTVGQKLKLQMLRSYQMITMEITLPAKPGEGKRGPPENSTRILLQ